MLGRQKCHELVDSIGTTMMSVTETERIGGGWPSVGVLGTTADHGSSKAEKRKSSMAMSPSKN